MAQNFTELARDFTGLARDFTGLARGFIGLLRDSRVTATLLVISVPSELRPKNKCITNTFDKHVLITCIHCIHCRLYKYTNTIAVSLQQFGQPATQKKNVKMLIIPKS